MTPDEDRLDDLEQLAALLDGRLSPDERGELLRRLEDDPDLYELWIESARLREEEGVPVSTPPPPRWGPWIALAAALLAALGAVLYVGGPSGSDREALPTLVAEVAAGLSAAELAADWADPPWARIRGSAAAAEQEAAVRTGYGLFDLQLALRLGRTEDAVSVSRRTEHVLTSVALAGGIRDRLATVRSSLEGSADPATASQLAAGIPQLAAESLPDLAAELRLGWWVAAGLRAAESENLGVLRSPAFSSALRELQSGSWSPGRQEALAAVEVELRGEPDLGVLRSQLVALVEG